MNDLQSVLDKVSNWAKDHSVLLFHGLIKAKKVIARWDTEEEDILKFLEVAEKNNVKHIIIFKSTFILEDEVNAKKIVNLGNAKEKYLTKGLYGKLKEKDGKIDFIEVSWVSIYGDGVVYQYSIYDEEITSILTEIKQFEDIAKTSANKWIKDVAKNVASHPDYYAGRYYSERLKVIIGEILESDGIEEVLNFNDEMAVFREASDYFTKHLLHKREKEVHAEVHKLKIRRAL